MQYRFETINQNNGLSNNAVNALYKDADGFLWIGTEDGLNKYDGTKFKVYRHYSNDSTSLVGNHVYDIYPSSAGKLWISSHCWGLSELNTYSGKSVQHKENKADKNTLFSNCDIVVFKDDDGNTWVKNYSTLLLYHSATNTFSKEFQVMNDSSIIYRTTYYKSIIWMGLSNNTIGYNIKTTQLIPSPLAFNKEAATTQIIN